MSSRVKALFQRNMSKKPTKKLKWTDQMNKDLLMCTRKALEIVASENPPRKHDSRKRGYIKVMKQLWEESGYQNLGLKAQNLRDQASQLEKLQESSATTTLEESLLEISSRSTQTLTGMVNCDAENNQNYDDQESHYANSSSTSMQICIRQLHYKSQRNSLSMSTMTSLTISFVQSFLALCRNLHLRKSREQLFGVNRLKM